MDKYRAEKLDCFLVMLNKCDTPVLKKHIFSEPVLSADCDKVIAFLVAEGFAKEDTYSVEITEKGRIYLDEGGFRGHRRRRLWQTFLTVLTAAMAVLGVAVQLVLYYCG